MKKIRINHTLGLFPSTPFGGISHAMYVEFVFPAQQTKGRSRQGLLGGAQDDTGGSSSAEIDFIGDLSHRPFLFLWCSFVDGVDRGVTLPLLYTLKSRYFLSQIAASAMIGVSLAPWLLKPLLGLLTDTVPVFGLRRKPYIMGSATVNVIALILIAYAQAHQLGSFVVPLTLMIVRTFGRAMIDSAAQGLLLEECRDTPSGEMSDQARTSVMVSRFQASHRLGQFISVCSAGIYLSHGSLTPIYLTLASLHLSTVLIAWSTHEEPVSVVNFAPNITVHEKFNQLTKAVSSSQAFRNVLEYAFLSMAVPSYEAPMTYYLLDARHFSLSNISVVNIVMTSGSLVAPVVYAKFFQRSKYSTLMTGLTIASIPAGLTPLIITTGFAARNGIDEVFIASLSAFTISLFNDLQMLPAHVLVAQLAPKGLEGSSLSVLSLVIDGARVVSNGLSSALPALVGAAAPRYQRMSLYIALCTLFNVGPFSAIEGFDEGVEPIKIEDLGESSQPSPTLGGVMKELQTITPASPESDTSPIAQVVIKPSKSSAPETN